MRNLIIIALAMTNQNSKSFLSLNQEQSYAMGGQSPVVQDPSKTVNLIGIIGVALPIFLLLCAILYKKLYLKKLFTKDQIIRRAIGFIIYYFVFLILFSMLKLGLN